MEDLLPREPALGLLARLLVSVGIGLLIGLEREHAKRVVEHEEQLFAGIRTTTLFALLGFVSALMAAHAGAWILALALAGLLAFLVTAYALTARPGSFGGTTEMSGVLAFLLGAVVHEGHVLLAVATTVLITLLLSAKAPLHRFVASLSHQEVRAIIQFTLIAAVIRPLLPTTPFGPGGIWALREIWTMVVLVSGISLCGYLLAHLVGGRKGTLWTAVIGGLVSSTAVAWSAARRASEGDPAAQRLSAAAILAAGAVMYPRVILLTAVLKPDLALQLAPALLAAAAGALLSALVLLRGATPGRTSPLPVRNPLEFRMALQFALLFVSIQWALAWCTTRFGEPGTYAAAVISGSVDMDAVTLSVTQDGTAAPALVILAAAAANTLFKALLVASTAPRITSARVWAGSVLALALGALAGWASLA